MLLARRPLRQIAPCRSGCSRISVGSRSCASGSACGRPPTEQPGRPFTGLVREIRAGWTVSGALAAAPRRAPASRRSCSRPPRFVVVLIACFLVLALCGGAPTWHEMRDGIARSLLPAEVVAPVVLLPRRRGSGSVSMLTDRQILREECTDARRSQPVGAGRQAGRGHARLRHDRSTRRTARSPSRSSATRPSGPRPGSPPITASSPATSCRGCSRPGTSRWCSRSRLPASAPCRTRSSRSTATARSASSPRRPARSCWSCRGSGAASTTSRWPDASRRPTAPTWPSWWSTATCPTATRPRCRHRPSRRPPETTSRSPGSSTRRAPPPTPRAPGTPTGTSSSPPGACATAWDA